MIRRHYINPDAFNPKYDRNCQGFGWSQNLALDEATAPLHHDEVDTLFDLLQELRSRYFYYYRYTSHGGDL